jgi:hypothetical protein
LLLKNNSDEKEYIIDYPAEQRGNQKETKSRSIGGVFYDSN